MSEMIRVVAKQPGASPRTMLISNRLESLQNRVGGYIETVSVFRDVVMICNEEGKLKHMPINFFAKANGYVDAIVGPAIFCRTNGWEFTSIEDEDIEMIKEVAAWKEED